MKKLDKFIIQSFFWPFLVAFLLVTFILMMQFLWLYIDELVGKGLSLGIIAEFLGWGCATLIPMALPLATLFASIMTMGNKGENNELLAMKSAGISLQRVLAPLIILAVLISIGAFFASNNLIPIAYNQIYTLREDIGRTKSEIKIPTGTFYNGIEGYTLRINSRDEHNIMHNIMVYNHSADKGNVNVTVADSGEIKLTSDKKDLIFILFNGTNYEDDNIMNFTDTSLVLKKINFTRQELIIPLQNYAFEKSKKAKYGNEVMAKNLSQLKIDKDSLQAQYNEILEMKVRSIVYTTNLLYTQCFDSTYTSKYKGVIPADSLFKWESAQEELQAYDRAIASIDNQRSNVEFYGKELYQYGYPFRRTIVESYRKFTLSLACLIFFFIGAPLGAIIRKGGLGTPVIISMLFFVVYYVVDISGKKLANDGAVFPIIGTFISTLVLLPMGIFLTWKSTRDSNLFNADVYLHFLKMIANFFKAIMHKGTAETHNTQNSQKREIQQ
jgi:lipopolysaccharide export system permease protein